MNDLLVAALIEALATPVLTASGVEKKFWAVKISSSSRACPSWRERITMLSVTDTISKQWPRPMEDNVERGRYRNAPKIWVQHFEILKILFQKLWFYLDSRSRHSGSRHSGHVKAQYLQTRLGAREKRDWALSSWQRFLKLYQKALQCLTFGAFYVPTCYRLLLFCFLHFHHHQYLADRLWRAALHQMHKRANKLHFHGANKTHFQAESPDQEPKIRELPISVRVSGEEEIVLDASYWNYQLRHTVRQAFSIPSAGGNQTFASDTLPITT